MLFMITQEHSPETCPIDAGGSEVLFNADADGVTMKGRWGAWATHKVWYLVEADGMDGVQRFLDPGMKLATSTVEPVGEAPVSR
jgi:hypothetical protein